MEGVCSLDYLGATVALVADLFAFFALLAIFALKSDGDDITALSGQLPRTTKS
jgi:hypothetical protein